jgi:hypothetical protein
MRSAAARQIAFVAGVEAIKTPRLEHASPEGQQRYQRRAGIEGIISQGVRAFGLRRSRIED